MYDIKIKETSWHAHQRMAILLDYVGNTASGIKHTSITYSPRVMHTDRVLFFVVFSINHFNNYLLRLLHTWLLHMHKIFVERKLLCNQRIFPGPMKEVLTDENLRHQFPLIWTDHYSDVIMSTMASRITSLTIVYSTVYSGADQWKHQSPASLAFVRGIHHKWVSNAESVSIWWRHHVFHWGSHFRWSNEGVAIIKQLGTHVTMIFFHRNSNYFSV